MPGDWSEIVVRERIAELHRQADRERLARLIRSGRRSTARRTRSARWERWAAWFRTRRARLPRRPPSRRQETLAEQGDQA